MINTFKASLKAINEALKRGEITLDTSQLVMIDELAEFTREDQAALKEWKAKAHKAHIRSYRCEL